MTIKRAVFVDEVVQQWDIQGQHRTGTAGDWASGDWLTEQASRLGVPCDRQQFDFMRVCPDTAPIANSLQISHHTISGLPLFDAPTTGIEGVSGRIVPIGEDGEIGFVELTPDAATLKDEPFSLLRRRTNHRAIVVATRIKEGAIAPLNARAFPHVYGPPVLQVAGHTANMLRDYAEHGEQARVNVGYQLVESSSFNIVSKIKSTKPIKPPLIIVTPRTAWFTSTAERAGGIAIWLSAMAHIMNEIPMLSRDVWLVATAGHEVGHIGLGAFVKAETHLTVATWLHLGANLGAAADTQITLRASDEAHTIALAIGLEAAGYQKSQIMSAFATHSVGEARDLVELGAPVVSLVGNNDYFHSPDDRLPHAVSLPNLHMICKAILNFLPTLYIDNLGDIQRLQTTFSPTSSMTI